MYSILNGHADSRHNPLSLANTTLANGCNFQDAHPRIVVYEHLRTQREYNNSSNNQVVSRGILKPRRSCSWLRWMMAWENFLTVFTLDDKSGPTRRRITKIQMRGRRNYTRKEEGRNRTGEGPEKSHTTDHHHHRSSNQVILKTPLVQHNPQYNAGVRCVVMKRNKRRISREGGCWRTLLARWIVECSPCLRLHTFRSPPVWHQAKILLNPIHWKAGN